MNNKLLLAFVVMLMALNFSSCKKKDPNNGGSSNSGAPSITSNYYFQANINGSWVTFQHNNTTLFAGYGSNYSATGDTIKGYSEFSGISDLAESNGGGIGGIGVNKLYELDSIDQFNLFKLGTRTYGRYNSDSIPQKFTAGVYVSYLVNDVLWSSDLGSGDQTGSSFTITEFIDNNTDYTSEKIVAATFSCKLYDGNGNSKTVTNGKYRGRVIDLFP